ncbi:MAG TPA: LPS export ABC transporter periplasmic protein LptC [Methylomirabilota bacterium]|nr:LPS export ABC transporter periplasmic protein LptC [Methylomirabilota bacterium]
MARVILVVVAVFVVAVTATLVVKSRTARVESLGPMPTHADLQIKEVDLEEESRGVRWRLKAEQALMFEQAGQTQLRKLVASVQERQRAWTIVGEEGDLDRKTNNVEVRRNVIVTSDDGLRLETSVLRWDAAGKRLWTDAPVTLTRRGSVVRGSGLDVRVADEATTIIGPVRAVFVTGKSR